MRKLLGFQNSIQRKKQMEISYIINKINKLSHEESEALSPELQAFINGWNNALKECVNLLESLND